MSVQGRFNLAQLNPEPANAHLIVGTSDKLDAAICCIAHQVTSPVHPGTLNRGERISHKARFRQVRTVPIAARQTFSPDVQLSDYPYRYRLSVFIQHVDRHIVDRATNRRRRLALAQNRYYPSCRNNRIFCRPVLIHERKRHVRSRVLVQRITARQHVAQRRSRRPWQRKQVLSQRSRQKADGDACLDQPVPQFFRR